MGARFLPLLFTFFASLLLAATTLFTAACESPREADPEQVVIWNRLGEWSGRGNRQTESFASDTGSLRVQWRTGNERPTGAGIFRLTIHSAISGRPLLVAVEHQGNGRDTAYISEDPRVFHAVVESANLDWSFTVEEAVPGTRLSE